MKLINLDDALVAIASTNGNKGDMLWALYNLPNVDSRPKGKWRRIIRHAGLFVQMCTECGFTLYDDENYNYCPGCGADMRKETKKGETHD